MDYARLFEVADRARKRAPLSDDDIAYVRDELPAALAAFPDIERPDRVTHPSGFKLSGAPVGTYIVCALLLAGRKALGDRFGGHPFYERVETEMAMRIMRSNFHGGMPKGTHCCVQCTLGVLPVLEAGAIRYFECKPLAHDVREMISTGGWRFDRPVDAKMKRWALEGPV